MRHVAIDLGSRESQICVRSETGEIVEERRIRTEKLSRFLSREKSARVVVETAAEAFRVADMALELGHEVRVVPSVLVRSLGVGQRGLKNDVRDARVLSEVSCRIEIPSVHIPCRGARELKSLCASRELLVGSRTKLINRIRGYLRTRVCRELRATPKTFADRVRTRLTSDSEGLPNHIEAVLSVVSALNVQIACLDEELARLAGEDERVVRLMTVPGVGPVTATRFVAAVDEVARFPNSAQLASYFGLTPGESTTGFRTQRTRVTKAGCTAVRWALVQAAWGLWRSRPEDPLVLWAKEVSERRGKQVMIVALARKLATVLYAMWRNETEYEPGHSRRARS